MKIVIVLVVAFMHFGLLAWLSIGPGGTIDPCVTTPSGLGKGPDTQACIEHKKTEAAKLVKDITHIVFYYLIASLVQLLILWKYRQKRKRLAIEITVACILVILGNTLVAVLSSATTLPIIRTWNFLKVVQQHVINLFSVDSGASSGFNSGSGFPH